MIDRAVSGLARVTKTDIVSGFLIHWADTNNPGVDAGNVAMEKADFEAYIADLLSGTWSSKTTVVGATDLIGAGAVASFKGFEIEFIIDDGTNTTIGHIRLVYTNSTAKAYPPNMSGEVTITFSGTSAVKIEQCSVISGQMYWKITNNLAGSITTQYRVTQFPA